MADRGVQDIKLQNIFLDTTRGPLYDDVYPAPQLGDFGLAVQTDSQDQSNPEFW